MPTLVWLKRKSTQLVKTKHLISRQLEWHEKKIPLSELRLSSPSFRDNCRAYRQTALQSSWPKPKYYLVGKVQWGGSGCWLNLLDKTPACCHSSACTDFPRNCLSANTASYQTVSNSYFLRWRFNNKNHTALCFSIPLALEWPLPYIQSVNKLPLDKKFGLH